MKKILIKFSGVFLSLLLLLFFFLLYYLWGPSLGWMEPAEKISGALYYFRSSCFPLFVASQSVLYLLRLHQDCVFP